MVGGSSYGDADHAYYTPVMVGGAGNAQVVAPLMGASITTLPAMVVLA